MITDGEGDVEEVNGWLVGPKGKTGKGLISQQQLERRSKVGTV